MTAETLEILKSSEGRLLGLDGHTDAATNEYAPFLTGDGLRGMRIYPIGKAFIPGTDFKLDGGYFYNTLFDDFVGAALNTFSWNANKGSDSSTNVALAFVNNGVCRLTSGAGSTHTMAVNGAQLTSGKNLLISDGETKFETRMGNLSAATSQSIFAGLCDSSTLSAPFTAAAGVISATGTNAVGFLQDAAGTGIAAGLCAVAVNAGGTVQSVNLGKSVGLSTVFDTYRVAVDAAGNATFYIDGAKVATIALAVATTAVLCPAVGMFSEATSASQTLDLDTVWTQSLRV